MASVDALFAGDQFGMANLTTAMNRIPFKPSLLQTLGLFQPVPINTTVAMVEEKFGKLALINSAARGSTKDVRSAPDRRTTPFKVPHFPYFQTVMADDILNVRAFGSETEVMAVAAYINEQLAGMKNDHDTTQEWIRLGALKGLILDGDGTSTLYDLYAQFGITQTEIDWTHNVATPVANAVPTVCSGVIRAVADALGSSPYGQIFALCGNTYFDSLTHDPDVKQAYDRWRNGEFLRMSQLGPEWYSVAMNGFEYQGIFFLNYRGTIGDVDFVADAEAYYFPTGTNQVFQEIMAPADFMETVGTMGKRYYAKMEPLAFNKGAELHTQHNILAMNSTPGCVIKSTVTVA